MQIVSTNAVPQRWSFSGVSRELFPFRPVRFASLARAALALHFQVRSTPKMPFTRQRTVRTHNEVVLLALFAISSSSIELRAQKLDPSLYSSLEWRMIGP